jgi:predicted acylesterase/phospholipase RssA
MPPAELLAKTLNGEVIPFLKGRLFLDGSIGDDLPIRRLTRLYGVNHSIVSMVNPLVLPFASRRAQHGSDLGSLSRRYFTRLLKDTAYFSLEVLQKGIPSDNLNFAIDKLQAVMMQEYRGDITLVPPRRLIHILNLVRNHSPDEEREFLVIGQRLTWPYLEMIKNTTAISRTFRDCIALLQAPAVRARRKPGRARRNGARHG